MADNSLAEKLAEIVGKLENLSAERDKALQELLELQEKVNKEVQRFRPTETEGTPLRRRRGRPPKESAAAPGTKRRGRPPGAVSAKAAGATKRGRKKGSVVKCSLCGKVGHNSRTCPQKKAGKSQE